MKAHQLVQILQECDPDTEVLVDGYESGFGAVQRIVVQELDRDDKQQYEGAIEVVAEARRQAALPVDAPEIALGGVRPPTLVSEPFAAIVLHRPQVR